MLPSDLQSLIRMTADSARGFLSRSVDTSTAGAAQAAKLVDDWTGRMGYLASRWNAGQMTADALAKAVRSEAEALPLNLAAIVNETRRAVLADLLQSSLGFVLKLLGGRT